ncbi:HutD-family protein [Rhizobium sp. Root708]|uniref:HutD/Ves family protein n=1 Tax=Rhizobium sp. Root708 TaxID=1736592 RepID=UPI0006FA2E09|nr:HutD family protein [Rhizobium sp. Root708]KRB59399.1 HutD-family protein [Rhizobium sp. Root708]
MPHARVLKASSYRRMPWKNGGGETVEIAVSPPDAALSDFDWRVSMATVATDGPFSIFVGIDRTLSILEGAGMALAIDGAEPRVLTTTSEPLSFPADVAVSATLPGGPITDLNVMTRRARLRHRVERIEVDGRCSVHVATGTWLVLCQHGTLSLGLAGEPMVLDAGDTFLAEGAADTVLSLTGQALSYLISIDAA